MELQQQVILKLIYRCLAGTATDQEFSTLSDWVSYSEENRKYYLQIKNIRENYCHQIKPEEIETDRALNNLLEHISYEPRQWNLITFLQKAAAVLIIPLIAASFFWGRSLSNNNAKNTHGFVYNEVMVAFGTRSAITLSDGSKVWLNSGSRLKYPEKFSDKNRIVTLTGEGYFEVVSDKSHPFIVNTRNLQVKATGTKFNVNATGRKGEASITLVSGKVSVAGSTPEGKWVKMTDMLPNQHISVDTLTKKVTTTKVDPYRFIAWKDGKLIFRNEPLNEVIQDISYYYNVDIELKGDQLKEYKYRATFEEENINEILKLLKLSSPVDYYEISRQLLPDGTFSRKKFIIYYYGEKAAATH